MNCPTEDDIEIVSGLGASGVEMILVYEAVSTVPGNPMVPTIRIGTSGELDVKINAGDEPEAVAKSIMKFIREVKLKQVRSAADRLNDVAFQVTRGREGISL
jgi:uncharacterized protein (UPF0210 family)